MLDYSAPELDACLQPLLESLETLLAIQRRLIPVFLNQLKEKATALTAPLRAGRDRLVELPLAQDLKSNIDSSFVLAEKAVAAFSEIPD